jgi:hypothetical protein
MTACQEAMEAYPEEIESETEDWEVPKEGTEVKSFGGLKRRRDGHLAVGQSREPKKWTQRNCESWKKLADAGRKMTHHAGVAQCQEDGQDNVVCGTQRRQTLGTRCRVNPEGSTGTRNQYLCQQLCLRSKRTSGGIYRMIFVLEIAKRLAGPSLRMWEVQDWTLLMGLAPSEMEKETAHREEARNVKAPANRGSYAPS